MFACSPRIKNTGLQKFEWSPSRKLTWEDYKAVPSRTQHDKVAARSTCRFGITIDTSAGVKVNVTSEFISSLSNVRAGQQTAALLAHEQLHFDLCEVYARLLRKELANGTLTKTNVAAISKDAFLKYYQVYWDRQLIYDKETDHGLNAANQQLWNEQVATALKDLQAYAK
jgi:hypothetical protein